MGRFLAESDLLPDLVLASTALRARRTAELAVAGAGLEMPVALVEDLYLSNPSMMIKTVARQGGKASRVMLVAHNPGCAELVAHFAGQEYRFPTATLAAIDFDIAKWSDLDLGTPAEVRGVWRPKQLD